MFAATTLGSWALRTFGKCAQSRVSRSVQRVAALRILTMPVDLQSIPMKSDTRSDRKRATTRIDGLALLLPSTPGPDAALDKAGGNPELKGKKDFVYSRVEGAPSMLGAN